MLEFWESLAYTTKFSAIATAITSLFGLFSMCFLGLGLYSTVSFLFSSYPPMKKWDGDWIWPALIGSGMAWSLGFVFGDIAWHYLSLSIASTILPRIYIRLFFGYGPLLCGV